jgi:hypothetical protein
MNAGEHIVERQRERKFNDVLRKKTVATGTACLAARSSRRRGLKAAGPCWLQNQDKMEHHHS